MSTNAIVLNKKCKFKQRFVRLCEQEPSKTLDQWGSVFDVTRQTVANWQSGNSFPDIGRLMLIAEYFGVSSDYLLGITETQSQDITIQGVVSYTGLNERAIEKLHSLRVNSSNGLNVKKEDVFPLISKFITCDNFTSLFNNAVMFKEKILYLETMKRTKYVTDPNRVESNSLTEKMTEVDIMKLREFLLDLRKKMHMSSSTCKDNETLFQTVSDIFKYASTNINPAEDKCDLLEIHIIKDLNRFLDSLVNEAKEEVQQTFNSMK